MIVGGATEAISFPVHECKVPEGLDGPGEFELEFESELELDMRLRSSWTSTCIPGLLPRLSLNQADPSPYLPHKDQRATQLKYH
jgi:hypothetical protein